MYETILLLHITAFMVNIAVVVISDIHALLWVIGKLQTLPERRMAILHRIVSVGLAVSILSGAYLFWGLQDYLLALQAFQIKIALVAMLVINAFVIRRHMPIASSRTFASLTGGERWPLIISGLVSTVGWVGVFFAARSLGL